MNGREANETMGEKCSQCGAPLPIGVLAGLCPSCLLKQGVAPDTATQAETRAAFEPPSVSELTRLFPQLEILCLLGKGGMGAVYKARQPALDRLVALKILPLRGGADPGFAERFTREARALARLSHPSIVAVHEFGRADGLHYFIMEYVDGANLRQLEKAGRLSPREALQIIPQICDALQYAHDEGVVHRDIKPENVLVDRKGRVKIADFGLARILGQPAQDFRLTGSGQVMGTPHYMAPEQVEHPLEVDHRADIYSLGVVFYEMLTGELPLGKFPPPSRKVRVDVRFDEVVLHALEKEPDRRYQQAGEVKTELQKISATPGGASAFGVAPGMGAVPAWAAGVDYKSKTTFFGLPLFHVATGTDPLTGKRRTARGIIAIGNVAKGVVALGGVAMGGIAMGGLSIGIISLGGLSLGLVAIGALAFGLGIAAGGGAIAPIALGGGALGYLALGGGSLGVHSVSALGLDPEGWDFFAPLLNTIWRWSFAGVLCLMAVTILLVTLVPAGIQWRDKRVRRSGAFWLTIGVAVLCAGACLVPVFFSKLYLRLPQVWLISGGVYDARNGAGIPNAQVAALDADTGKILREALSAKDGSFKLLLPEPVRQVTASAPGYESNRVALGRSAYATNRHAHAEFQLGPPASSELWSPTLTPGQEGVLEKVLAEGRDLVKRGSYEDALQRFIWYHNHSQEFSDQAAWYNMLSILTDWIELGRRYPKARQALLEIRDQMAEKFLTGGGHFELFMQMSNINDYLHESDATLAVFDKMRGQDEALTAQCYPVVQPLLVKRGQFATCLKYIGDPQTAFDRIRRQWEFQKQSEQRLAETYERLAKQNPSFRPPKMPVSNDDRFVGQVFDLVEILVGAGQKTQAEKIRDQAVALLDNPRLESVVADAELKLANKQ